MQDLYLTRTSAPKEVPVAVYAEILRWMEEHQVERIMLDANTQGYGVLIDSECIPVGLVPHAELQDPKGLVERLEIAWNLYLSGANCTD
ncbi:MAG: hypothetical protein IVW51_08170 [Thermaceae bacterium]|nr:hypothetical protein [Thermaceae bacterium]